MLLEIPEIINRLETKLNQQSVMIDKQHTQLEILLQTVNEMKEMLKNNFNSK